MRITLIILLIIMLWSFTPLVNSNAYLNSDLYDVVYVKNGDTVWKIADKYITEKDDIRDLLWAIKEVNNLNQNAQIYPGQTLKIPVKRHTY